jgi:hypothetical protein
MLLALFVGYFDIGSCFILGLAWTVILLFVLSCVAGMTGVHHHIQPLLEMESCEVFA